MFDLFFKIKTEEQLGILRKYDFKASYILEPDVMDLAENADGKRLYLAMPEILREEKIDEAIKVIDGIAGRAGGIYINSPDALGLICHDDFSKRIDFVPEVIAGENLYCYNSQSIGFIRNIASKTSFICPAELSIKEIKEIEKKSGLKFIYKIYGHQLLMTTAQKLSENINEKLLNKNFKEKRNIEGFTNTISDEFYVSSEADKGYVLIYKGFPTYMFDKISDFMGDDRSDNECGMRLLVDFTIENECETEAVCEDVRALLNGEMPQRGSFTRGHYYKGVL